MSENAKTTESKECTDQCCLDLRDSKINGIIKQNMLWALGAGIIPVPFLDMAGIMVVQIKMLKEISDEHHVRFSESAAKSAIAALAAGLGAVWFEAFAIEVFSMVPVIGQAIHTVTVPILAAAFTYAIGHVFDNHFRAGGTLTDFNPGKVKEAFNKTFAHGQDVAKEMHKK
ncbi:MAG: DUF697 domain-containing protein [Oligoflexia bacterium]|nr:DUF697 domain-containing protein [Oligoflexia bacterium]